MTEPLTAKEREDIIIRMQETFFEQIGGFNFLQKVGKESAGALFLKIKNVVESYDSWEAIETNLSKIVDTVVEANKRDTSTTEDESSLKEKLYTVIYNGKEIFFRDRELEIEDYETYMELKAEQLGVNSGVVNENVEDGEVNVIHVDFQRHVRR